MTASKDCQILGRWRIVEADAWDRDHLDLLDPASITIGAKGEGEINFGAMQAVLGIGYSRTIVHFDWNGTDEGDQVNGSGSAELMDDGTLEFEFEYHNGDDTILKAVREPSSTAC